MVSLRPAEDLLSFNLLDSLSLEDVTFSPEATQDPSRHHAPLSGAAHHPAVQSEASGAAQSTVFTNPGAEERSGCHGQDQLESSVTMTADSVPPAVHVSVHSINIAGMHVTDALNFRNVPFRPDKLTLYHIYQDPVTRFIFVLFPILLLALALIEDPAVPTLDVHWQAKVTLEVICLLACVSRVLHLRACIQPADFWWDIKNWVILASISVTVVDLAVWLTFKISEEKTVIRLTRVLRPLLIVNFSENRNLRKLLRNIKRTVLDVFSVLVLILIFIAIFAMMATKFFQRRDMIDPQGDPYLDNFLDSYWNLYVLMTTANSPDVSLPAFRDEFAFFFFFTPFSIITTFILMNILLAVVYKHYRLHLLAEVKVDVAIIQDNLEKAFTLLRDPATDHIPREVWDRAYRKLGCTDALQKLYWEYMVPDVGGPGISSQAFFKITDLLSSKIEIVVSKKTWLESALPRFYNSTVCCYTRYIVDHIFFTLFYDVLIFANAVVLAIPTAPAFLETVFLVFFNIEIGLKVFTYGPQKFASTVWNVYDCIVIWAATIFTMLVTDNAEKLHDSKDQEISIVFLDMVLTLRVLRLLKLLTSIPQLRLIVNTLMQIVPSMASYALLLFLFYYSYAIIGMEMFSGKILNGTEEAFCGNKLLNGTEFVEENYCVLSFNNILYSFVVLWTLTLVNQWHILAGGFVAVTNKAARLYFLSFHIIIVLIILNIFLAFVIEAFMMQIEVDENRQEGIDQHLEERGENARRDTHPLSEAVWYRKQSLQHSTGEEEEDEDPNKVYIGTSPLQKIRYKRQKSAKSYNQLLLEMFQGDIKPGEAGQGMPGEAGPGMSGEQAAGGGDPQSNMSMEGKRRLTSLKEEETEEGPRQFGDDFSMGSLENMDII